MGIVTGVACQGANGRERLPRSLYVSLRTYRLYFVALHSGVNQSSCVGFPEGAFSNVEVSPGSILR
jgi:hypothetical protein